MLPIQRGVGGQHGGVRSAPLTLTVLPELSPHVVAQCTAPAERARVVEVITYKEAPYYLQCR